MLNIIITRELALISRVVQHINNRAVLDFLPMRNLPPADCSGAISEVAAVTFKNAELSLLSGQSGKSCQAPKYAYVSLCFGREDNTLT